MLDSSMTYQLCEEPGVCPVCGHRGILDGPPRTSVRHVSDRWHYWGPRDLGAAMTTYRELSDQEAADAFEDATHGNYGLLLVSRLRGGRRSYVLCEAVPMIGGDF